jgi:hypothetical protein
MNMNMQNDTSDFASEAATNIRHISCEQLENLGLDEVAYVKPVLTQNGPAFAIHAADGRPMALVSTEVLAAAVIIQNDMAPRLVH